MVSYVPKDDVLQYLNKLGTVSIILVVIMLAVAIFVIMFVVNGMITKPVRNLTDTIVKISEGDFTVDIKEGGTNEIGVMNNKMHDYVKRMRETLGEMMKVTHKLSDEAESSRIASKNMSEQADKQSQSMEQIHDSMEGVANSVNELAINATDLAQAVSEVTEQGDAANNIMVSLLEKAKQGQRDMDNVQNNMDSISVSMSEMSEVVSTVDEAAQKISTIVEMINAIS